MLIGSHDAAFKIVALINSRPRSPSVCEIESIISGLPAPSVPCESVLKWHRDVLQFERDSASLPKGTTDEEWGVFNERFVAKSKAILTRPVRSWEDVALLGACTLYWIWPATDPGLFADMEARLNQADTCGMDEQSLAHLLRAICTMGGYAPSQLPIVRGGANG